MPRCVPAPQHKSHLGAVLGGSWGRLGSSWVVLGGSWEISGDIFLVLGRSWTGFGSASVAKALPKAIFFEFVLLLGRAEP